MGQLRRQQQQQLLMQELTISQILRFYGKQFTQIIGRYTDGRNGRCAMGVIMEYYGWNGKQNSNTTYLQASYCALKKSGVSDDIIFQMNDTGKTFDEIADFLDRYRNGLATNHSLSDKCSHITK